MPIKLDGSTGVITSTSSLTTGSVLFAGAGGGAIQDNANFFWDDTNNRLGVGTATPTVPLEVSGAVKASSLSLTTQLSVANGGTGLTSLTAGRIPFGAGVSGTDPFGNSANLVWDNTNGRLGVGTASPAASIQIAAGNLRLANTAQIEWGGSTNSIDASNATNVMRFWTNNSQAMTLDASGNLGVGTSNPSTKLDIGSTASAGSLSTLTFSGLNSASAKTNYAQMFGSVEFNPAGGEGGGFTLKVLQQGAYKNLIVASGITNNASNYLAFSTTNEAIRINSAGNVGIGNTIPSNEGTNIRLAVTGTAGQAASSLATSNSNAGFSVRANSSSGYMLAMGAIATSGFPYIQGVNWNGGAVAADLCIQPYGGNVGIGLTAPTSKLHVRGGRSTFEASSEPYSLYVAYNSSTSGVFLGGTSSGGFQISAAGGSPWLNVDSSGNLLVGTASNVSGAAKAILVGPVTTASGIKVSQISAEETNATVNSSTYSVGFNNSCKVFAVTLSNGDGALVVTSYTSSTITILGSGGAIVASASPAAGEFGISKSANSHNIVFKTGSSATLIYGQWQVFSLTSSVG